MTWHAARYEELFCGRQVDDAFGRGRGIRPGPGGEFVDEIVAGEDEFFGCHLARCAERGGMRDWGPAVAESIEGRVDYIHVLYVYWKEVWIWEENISVSIIKLIVMQSKLCYSMVGRYEQATSGDKTEVSLALKVA